MLKGLNNNLYFSGLKDKVKTITFYRTYEFESLGSVPYQVIRLYLLLKLMTGIKPSYKVRNPEYKKYFLTCYTRLAKKNSIFKFLEFFFVVILSDKRLFHETLKVLTVNDQCMVFELKNMHLVFDKLHTNYSQFLDLTLKEHLNEFGPSLFAEDSFKLRIEFKNFSRSQAIVFLSQYGFNNLD